MKREIATDYFLFIAINILLDKYTITKQTIRSEERFHFKGCDTNIQHTSQ